MKIQLKVNGRIRELNIDPKRNLLGVLREELDLTGTKYGCGEAQCGACTVLVDGNAIRSCVTPVAEVANKSITTIEGLEQSGKLHPVQEAFLKADAMQCAFCTSGMIMSAVALIQQQPNPNRKQIIEHMDGNMCRCGVYERILTAIEEASRAGK